MPDPLKLFRDEDFLSDDPQPGELDTSSSEPAAQTTLSETEQAQIRELEQQLVQKEQEHAALREAYWRADEREKQVQEARRTVNAWTQQYQQQQSANERPDPEIDPVGAQMWDNERQLQQLQSWQQQQQQAQQEYAFNSWLNSQGQATAQAHPDYADAVGFVIQSEKQLWLNAGYDEQQANNLVAMKGRAIAEQYRRNGKSFTDALYAEATARGYRSAGQQQQSQQPAQGASKYRNLSAEQLAALPEKEWLAAMRNPKTAKDLEYAANRADGLFTKKK